MEVTGSNKNDDSRRIKKDGRSNGLFIGTILILAGLLVVGRNTGAIDYYLYNIFMSWQMVLVLVGGFLLARRDYNAGLIVMAIGAFFLIPRITGAGPGWFAIYRPMALILIGVLIILKVSKPSHRRRRNRDYGTPTRTASGFVELGNVFGNYENIVLDEVFTGADIRGTLSGTVLDLRHTNLPEGETYIDLQCVLSGVELYLPADWEILSEVKVYLGGVEDKRFGRTRDVIPGRRLVLRGNVTLGGVTIKS